MRRRWVILVVVAALLAGAAWLIAPGLVRSLRQNLALPNEPIPIISTRGEFRNGRLKWGHKRYAYELDGIVPGMAGTPSPRDLVIIVHGFNNEPLKAIEKTGVAAESLRLNGYEGAVAGFSWDADTQKEPLKITGTEEALRNAKGNGPKLAQFLIDYQAKSPQTRLHIVGYSMGALVALEALKALDEDKALKEAQLKVDTVFLLGAYVPREEVEVGRAYGKAIERHAGVFWNYFSPKDSKLAISFPLKEGHLALGVTDIEHPRKHPANYHSRDVSGELLVYDSAGKLIPAKTGDNHSDYLGQRDAQMKLLDDGVMNLVAGEIRTSGKAK